MTNAQGHTFNWHWAIERNRAALSRIVAALFFMAGLDEGGADELPRRVWRKILVVLRPAESAVRRLIVVAARDIEIAPPRPRAAKAPTALEELQAKGLLVIHEGIDLGLARMWRPQPVTQERTAPVLPAFRLTDPPRRFDKLGWDGLRPFPQDGFTPADADELVNAAPVCRRLAALKNALDDLDRHAKRLARREARADLVSRPMQGRFAPAQLKGANHRRTLRRGHPPGHRRRLAHPVAGVLAECHSLALSLPRERPDTS